MESSVLFSRDLFLRCHTDTQRVNDFRGSIFHSVHPTRRITSTVRNAGRVRRFGFCLFVLQLCIINTVTVLKSFGESGISQDLLTTCQVLEPMYVPNASLGTLTARDAHGAFVRLL